MGEERALQYRLPLGITGLSADWKTLPDTRPRLIPAVRAVAAAASGGGTCTTASSVVTERTQVRGT